MTVNPNDFSKLPSLTPSEEDNQGIVKNPGFLVGARNDMTTDCAIIIRLHVIRLSSFVPLCLCAFVPFFVPLCLPPFVPLCLSSKKAEDAQFGAEALVVVELGVGVACFVDDGQLGAESEEGEGAVEDGELVGLRVVHALFGSAGEVGPVGLVETAGDGAGGAEVETEGQGVERGEAETGSCETPRSSLGAFVSIAESEAQGKRRGGLPACSEGDVPARAVEVFQFVVTSIVPARLFDGDPVRAEALRAFEAQAVFHIARFVARPLLASTGL